MMMELTAGDGFFSTTLIYKTTAGSENIDAISLLPERAEYFFFQMIYIH